MTEYNVLNGPIRWNKTVVVEHFSLSTFSRYSHFKSRDLEKIGQCRGVHLQWRHSMANTCFLFDGNSNICSISQHSITKQIQFQQFDLENTEQGQGEKQDLRHSNAND